MRTRVVMAVIAAVLMLGVVAAASANRLRILNAERGFRVAWTEDGGSETGGVVIACEVTLEGTFTSSTFAKVSGATIARVTRAISSNPCRRGNLSPLTETLPWNVLYRGFTGTLPVITGLKYDIINEAWRVEEAFTTCLYRTEASHPEKYILGLAENGGGLRRNDTWRVDETAGIPLTGLGCAPEIRFQGTATGSVINETAKNVYALI
jgi:hypothetical protein